MRSLSWVLEKSGKRIINDLIHFLKVKIHYFINQQHIYLFSIMYIAKMEWSHSHCIVNDDAGGDMISDIWFWYKGRQVNFSTKNSTENWYRVVHFALLTHIKSEAPS